MHWWNCEFVEQVCVRTVLEDIYKNEIEAYKKRLESVNKSEGGVEYVGLEQLNVCLCTSLKVWPVKELCKGVT